MAFRHKTVTLSGTVQNLHTAVGRQDEFIRQIGFQHDPANNNSVYVGGDDSLSASNFGFVLQNDPPGPDMGIVGKIGPFESSCCKLSDFYILGTAAQKVHVSWVPYT